MEKNLHNAYTRNEWIVSDNMNSSIGKINSPYWVANLFSEKEPVSILDENNKIKFYKFATSISDEDNSDSLYVGDKLINDNGSLRIERKVTF